MCAGAEEHQLVKDTGRGAADTGKSGEYTMDSSKRLKINRG